MSENKTGKYLKYAIGEIVLVVIGILIALSINNWNENRKKQQELKSILDIVRVDFSQDTLILRDNIKFYEYKNTKIMDVLKNRISPSLDSITEINYEEHFLLTRLATSYALFQKQSKGIELLKNIANNVGYEKDSLITNLIADHSKFKDYFDNDNETMMKLNFQNVEYFEKYSWFTDWLLFEYNRDVFQYFYDDEFKRKAGGYLQHSRQFLMDLEEYDRFAKTYIALIEKRLNE